MRLRGLLLVLMALGARTLTSTLPKFQRAWKSRGVYKDRRDMPPLKDAAGAIGVDPPLTAPRWAWSSAWRVGQWAMPILHRWDDANVSDTNVNLWVCWLKAIAGNRNRGGYADGGLAYEMLPSVTRRVVAKPQMLAARGATTPCSLKETWTHAGSRMLRADPTRRGRVTRSRII